MCPGEVPAGFQHSGGGRVHVQRGLTCGLPVWVSRAGFHCAGQETSTRIGNRHADG